MLDYHEGQLSEAEVSRLHNFVEQHHEFSIDPGFDNSLKLSSPNVVYADKTDLYKTDLLLPDLTEEELECLAVLEGDNPTQEVKQSNRKLFDQFEKTILVADPDIVFSNKKELHKKRILLPAYVYGAIATAAMLVFAWFIFSPNTLPVDPLRIAQDSTREVIFLDKLVHPDEFDLIASNTPSKRVVGPTVKKVKAEVFDQRDDVKLSTVQRLVAHEIPSLKTLNMNSSSAFVYRTIPYFETEEYKTFLAFSGEMIRKNILGQDPELVEKSKFSLWELADAGLEKVASTFSVPMDIEREYNDEGELIEVSFDSPLLAFSAPLNTRKGR